MPLLSFWKTAKNEVVKLSIQQAVANADGSLVRDQSEGSCPITDNYL